MEKRTVYLIGIGMGTQETLTFEAKEAVEKSQMIIGAERMLDLFEKANKPFFKSYHFGEIAEYIKEHPEYQCVAVVLSGDVGFYSGARKLICELGDFEVKLIPGISSVNYFFARLGIPWEDVKLYSSHGKTISFISAIRSQEKSFFILGTKEAVCDLAKKLTEYGMGDVMLHIGERLSYSDERITIRKASELGLDGELFDPLCVVYVHNPKASKRVGISMPDEAFLRGKVPMTKQEVRSASIMKLCLTKDSILYDVGAGTGSVSVEAALQSPEILVYAIEKNPEGIELIEANKRKFAVDNVITVPGIAPFAMEELPVPTHAFIGGSSGNLKQILELLLKKNPQIRVVLNAISLETIAEAMNCMRELPISDPEIVQMSIAYSKEIGTYHMMQGQNPITIFAFSGSKGTHET